MRSAVRSKSLSPATTPTEPVPESPGVLATDHRSRDHRPTPVGGVLDGGHSPSETPPNSASVDLPPGQVSADDQMSSAGGSLDSGRVQHDSHTASAAVDLDGGQNRDDTRVRNASVDLDRGQVGGYAHGRSAPVFLPPAKGGTKPKQLTPGADLNGDLHRPAAQNDDVAESEGNGHCSRDSQGSTADPSDALLLILADSLNDIEGLRKATANQLSALTRSSEIAGGKGLSEHGKAAVQLGTTLGILEALEGRNKKQRQGVPSVASKQIDEDGSSLILQLGRALRQHPLGPWVKSTVGIGEKQGARLIAAIGDPYWNHAEDRPRRGPAELWAYCGYAPGQKRKKGVQSNWNAEAKMRAFLCAESCIKQTGDAMVGADPSLETRPRSAENDDAIVDTRPGTATRRRSPYRDVYDQARTNWADRDTSDGHKHAHALRCVAKAILKDLYLAARAVSDSQPAAKTPVSANGATHKERT